MKRLLVLAALFAFLTGCMASYDNIRPDLRAKINPETGENLGYQRLVNGKWYESDKSGALTARGRMQKTADEAGGDDSGGGGGGGGGC